MVIDKLQSGAAEAAQAGAAALFQGLSRARGSRFFHPQGVAYRAGVRFDGASPIAGWRLRPRKSPYPAIIRFSRGAGFAQAIPDVLGFALPIENAYGPGRDQDLLMVTSGDGPVLHHLLIPATSFFSLPYSTVLTYRVGRREVLLGVIPPSVDAGPGTAIEQLQRKARGGGLTFQLAAAGLMERWKAIGEISVGDRIGKAAAEGLRFNPWNTGGGLVPSGPLQEVRRDAYRGSQKGRATRR